MENGWGIKKAGIVYVLGPKVEKSIKYIGV
jgi:hypothetical protein